MSKVKETKIARCVRIASRHFLEYRPQILVAAGAVFVLLCYLVGSARTGLMAFSGEHKKFPLLLYGITSIWPYFITLFGVAVYFGYVISKPEVKKDRLGNYYYANSEVGGACHWMTDAEKAEQLSDQKYEDTKEDILGYDIDDDGNMSDRILTAKQDVMFLNGHRCILGGSGSRKTTTQLLNHALQAIRRGESIILTDPKGELYKLLKILCEQHGYDVKQFNVAHPGNSDAIDILKELLPISYSDTYETDISTTCQTLATSIMQNTSDPNSEGKGNFWYDTSLGLIQAELFKLANSTGDVTFKDFCEDIQKNAVTFGKMFSDLPNDNPAKTCMANFFDYMQSGKGDLCAQILGGVRTRLQIFNNKAYQNIVSNQEIDLVKPGFKKCAYFVIMSDQTHMMDFIVAMFFSLIFIRLVAAADTRENQSLPVRVNFLMDEFYSSGRIEDFDNKLATVRSRNIGITMVLQNLGQLMIRYPKEHWEGIISNCDETVYIGGQDVKSTAEYVAARLGTVTAASESVGYHGFQQTLQRVSGSTSISEKERAVMTPAEIIQNLPKDYSIVLLKQAHPLLTGKVHYKNNPLAKNIREFLPIWHIPQWLRKERGYPMDMPDIELHKLVDIANRHKFYGYYPLPGQQYDSFDDFLEAYRTKTLPGIPKDAKSAMSSVKLKSFCLTDDDDPSKYMDNYMEDENVNAPDSDADKIANNTKDPGTDTEAGSNTQYSGNGLPATSPDTSVPPAPPAKRKTTKELDEEKEKVKPVKGAHVVDDTPDLELPPIKKRSRTTAGTKQGNTGSGGKVTTQGTGSESNSDGNVRNPVAAEPSTKNSDSNEDVYHGDPETSEDKNLVGSDDTDTHNTSEGSSGSDNSSHGSPLRSEKENLALRNPKEQESKEGTPKGSEEKPNEKKPLSPLEKMSKDMESGRKKSTLLNSKSNSRKNGKQLGFGKNI